MSQAMTIKEPDIRPEFNFLKSRKKSWPFPETEKSGNIRKGAISD
jgi:hypothetical protein